MTPPHSSLPLIGTDEAGFGPNLGPLVIAATRWDGPADSSEALRDLLADVASETTAPDRLPLADSKLVHSAGTPLAGSPLAQAACGTMLAAGVDPTGRTIRSLAAALDPFGGNPLAEPPWFAGDADAAGDPVRITPAVEAFAAAVAERGISVRVAADVIPAAAYNDLLDRYGSKGQLLSRRTLRLLRSLWRVGEPAAIVCDKHGGRDKYAELLRDCLADADAEPDPSLLFGPAVETVREGRLRSVYRVGQSGLTFEQKAESHLPVACASLVAKFVREWAMDAFNAYWSARREGLAPTRGYPNDAQRWRSELGDCDLDERMLWRRK